MSTKYVLYRSRQDFEAKRAIGIFSRESLKDYFRHNEPDGRYLVLEDSFFGKLQPVEKVGFLRETLLMRPMASPGSLPESAGPYLAEIVPPKTPRVSITLLSSDARKEISTRVQQLSALIAKNSGFSRDVATSDDPELHREFERLQREFPVSAMQRDFDELLEMLGRHDVWAESETSPIHWNMRGTEANFFGKPIRGLVFIFKNRFYAVEGAATVDDARAALVAHDSD